MSILHATDNLISNLIHGVGVFTLYAGTISGMYVTIQSIRAMDYKNITIYALMTGGLLYGLNQYSKNQGPFEELGIIDFDYADDEDYDEEEAEWIQ